MSQNPPEGLGLPTPELGWVDEASDEPTVDLLGALQRTIERARQPRKSSARVYASGGMTFEHNPLPGDTIVTGVQVVEPLEPGKIRLSSKRRGGSAEIGVNG